MNELNNFLNESFYEGLDIKLHENIKDVKIINSNNTFPISWLQKQGYCEYQIFLENFEGIEKAPTKAMLKGTKEHNKLEEKFLEKAKVSTFSDMMNDSKKDIVFSREFQVISQDYGIRGMIDEIIMTPDKFIIIDDKPGKKAYPSSINQVFGYCLAFQDMIKNIDTRSIVGAIRERGTENLVWQQNFDEVCKKRIVDLVSHVNGLINQEESFIPTKNPNKCKSCRYKESCSKSMV